MHPGMTLLDRVRNAKTARFWGRVAAGEPLLTWLHEPEVRKYVNSLISGSPHVWPFDAIGPLLGTTDHGVSLGCGDGTLDRQIVRRGICGSLTGIDISPVSLEVARRGAAMDGLGTIAYVQGDLNRLHLPANSCDAVFFQQSLHHVSDLEGCLDTVRDALRPGGFVYLDEYIGPSQSEWQRGRLRYADDVYRELPRRLRTRRHLQIPVDGKDPREAVRSSEILTELTRRFSIQVRKDYGGTLLSVIYPHLRLAPLSRAERDEVLSGLIEREREVIASGAPAFCAVILARRRDEAASSG
jgi:SAM-dependent methyltransferase